MTRSETPSDPADAGLPPAPAGVRPAELLLLLSVLVVAGCGLVYELCAGALSSYLLGDSVLQFSTVIGAYLFAMGVGSWLSKYVEGALVDTFIRVELMVGLIGGAMPAGLFLMHSVSPAPFRVLLYGWVGIIGVLVGLEIPLVMRILGKHTAKRQGLKDLVAQVLTFDYLGALAVSVAFPLLLVPHLGLARTGFFFGLLNAMVAQRIPGGRCAKVRHTGSREFIPAVQWLYTEWLPASGEQLRDFPPFFHYVNVGPDVAEHEMLTDVYLPLK
jgi:spermidine synthase